MNQGTPKKRARKRYFARLKKALPTDPLQPPRSNWPAVIVDDIAIVRETPLIETVLVSYGVEEADLPDVVQEVLMGAWRAMGAGQFRPKPQAPLEDSLRAWLYGISWRQASHYRGAAHRRYEIPSGQPSFTLDAGPVTESQVSARLLLVVFRSLPTKCQEVLALVAIGASIDEIARELGIPEGTVNTRIRIGRRRFHRALARWRK